MSRAEMTERIVRAMRHPCTTILGHPTGRLLLGRKGYEVDLDRILEVAAETGTLIEINANPYRLDLDWTHLEKARRMGVRFSIDPDTHRKSDLGDYVYGVGIARKGWLTAADVVNTLPVSELLDVLGQKRRRRP
jgi:DNA polymerase (family 10)